MKTTIPNVFLFLFFPLLACAITLKVDGDAFINVNKTVSWTRSATDPESFILVNVVFNVPATQGTQRLLETRGETSGETTVIAHFEGPHHILAFLNTTSIVNEAEPLASSNSFGIFKAASSVTETSISEPQTSRSETQSPSSVAQTSISATPGTQNSTLVTPGTTTVTISPSPSTPASNMSTQNNAPGIIVGLISALFASALV